MEQGKYEAAAVRAEIEVEAYERHAENGPVARRTVKVSFSEQFRDDARLDAAVDALAATIREAARR